MPRAEPKCGLELSPQCQGVLKYPGGILFSPPWPDDLNAGLDVALKRHVCHPCHDYIVEMISLHREISPPASCDNCRRGWHCLMEQSPCECQKCRRYMAGAENQPRGGIDG